MSHLPREIMQNSRSAVWDVNQMGYLPLQSARAMRDYAAQLGGEMPKYLLAPEIAVLLSYFDDLTQRMLFDTLWNTGARINEAMALTPANFELEPTRKHPQPVVALRTLKQRNKEADRKPGRPRSKDEPPHPDPRYRKPPDPVIRLVPLLDATYTQRMREYLATWKKRVKHQPIWSISSRQTPVNWLADALTKAERDGVTFPLTVTPHTFRHSFAMHLAMSGVPDRVLQSLLGHRYARSTAVYTRVFSLDALAGRGLSFSFDVQQAKDLISLPGYKS